MQIIVLLISLAGIILIASAFIYTIRNSSIREDDYTKVVTPAYKIRRLWMIALSVVGVVVTIATLTPFPLTAKANVDPVIIKAVGGQWYWNLDAASAEVNTPVQFHVSSADVNHGFALYNPSNKIIAQTQAMPGYVNKLNVTFSEPGTHRIMCLEYCGLAHHAMITEFEVTEAN